MVRQKVGKDTFADAFIKEAQDKLGYRCLKIKYGDIVKYVCAKYFGWDGTKSPEMRTLLQKIGTDVGRHNNEYVWINCVKEIVKALQTEYDFVLIPDCRFPNELNWEDTPFLTYTVRVNRKNEDGTDYINRLTEEQKNHPSETALDDWKFNYEIENQNLSEINAAAKVILDDIIKIDEESNMEE